MKQYTQKRLICDIKLNRRLQSCLLQPIVHIVSSVVSIKLDYIFLLLQILQFLSSGELKYPDRAYKTFPRSGRARFSTLIPAILETLGHVVSCLWPGFTVAVWGHEVTSVSNILLTPILPGWFLLAFWDFVTLPFNTLFYDIYVSAFPTKPFFFLRQITSSMSLFPRGLVQWLFNWNRNG